jgi:fused signal recognition particle receptor
VGVAAASRVAVKGGLLRRLVGVFTRRDPVARADAERVLLEADLGVEATAAILAAVERVPHDELPAALERAVATALAGTDDPQAGALARAATPPTVVLVLGVNGTGKTTTVAKLAARLRREGRTPLVAAADTFRAGAQEQLKLWAERLDLPFVGGPGDGRGDPAAVAFDALDAARARGSDTVLIDTAGRLHTDAGLLDELKKVVRVVAKRHPGAPHETLLVLDGGVGQNAVAQARTFAAAVPLTGLIVTKLDGTARGGSVVALRRAVNVPIRFLGTGESADDLEPFDAARYARRLVAE